MTRNLLLFATMLSCLTCTFSQTSLKPYQQKITQSLDDYFKLERENIHLHTNKSVYLSTEPVWFKGYVIEKKTQSPFAPTTNVYVRLLDDNGKTVSTHLIYAENSTFEGIVPLDKNLKSGIYYVQVYTNFMNNFSEDESGYARISIVNEGEGTFFNPNKINSASAEMQLYPEGGVLLEGVTNTIGVQVTDCYGNGVAVKEATISDAAGQVINTFSTGQNGYGRFDILNTGKGPYKVNYEVRGTAMQKELPLTAVSGMNFTVNNYTFPQKVMVKVRSNIKMQANDNAASTIVIQKNESASFIEFTFPKGKNEVDLVIPTDEFAPGINSLFLLNHNQQLQAQRVIFKPLMPASKIQVAVVTKRSDSLHIAGIIALPMGELSISVLPAETKAIVKDNDIVTSLMFNNYLDVPVSNAPMYATDASRAKSYELDNILLTRSSRYKWNSITGSAPVKKHEFDSGLSVKGTVNAAIADKENYKVNMKSYMLGINEYSKLGTKNDFLFNNVVLTDSAKVFFSLQNKKDKTSGGQMSFLVTGNNKIYSKPFNTGRACSEPPPVEEDFSVPQIAGAVLLKEVEVETKVKGDLRKTQRFNNSMARGYKISATEVTMYRDILSFIQANGYDVVTMGMNVTIRSRTPSTLMGDTSPAIFMDDTPLLDHSLLMNQSMDNVDEIYIDRRGYGAGMTGANGIIRIYTKLPTPGSHLANLQTKSQSMYVKDGFQSPRDFKRPEINVYDAGFQNFGVVHWAPKVSTDATGNFKLAIPNLNLKAVTLQIQGISSDGRMISEIITVPLQ